MRRTPLKTNQVACPSCGAGVSPSASGPVRICAYCGHTLWLDWRGGLLVEVYRPRLGWQEVEPFWKRAILEEGLPERTLLARTETMSLPFWTVPGQAGLLTAWSGFPLVSLPGKGDGDLAGEEDLLWPLQALEHDPPQGGGTLVYLPFYRLRLEEGQDHWLCWINALNGQVALVSERIQPRGNAWDRERKAFVRFCVALLLANLLPIGLWPSLVLDGMLVFWAGLYFMEKRDDRAWGRG